LPLPKKTVAVFDFVIDYGGAPAVTVLLARQLTQYYDVHVIDAYGTCAEYLNTLRQAGLQTHVLQPQARHTYFGYCGHPLRRCLRVARQLPALGQLTRRLAGTLRAIAPRLIWVNGPKSLAFLAASGATRRLPVAFYAQGWYLPEQYSRLHRWLIKHGADDFLAVSTATGTALRRWGIAERRIHVIYNPISWEQVSADVARGVQHDLPGRQQRPCILVPGFLARTKGQHTAIRAAGLWKQRGAEFTLWIAGHEAAGSHAHYEAHLRGLVTEYGLDGCVHFLGWRRDVPAIMAQADIVLLPTHTEGLPRVVEEAMLLRKPVITTPVGGIGDLIIDGQTGLLVPVEDERAVCAALARLTADPGLAQRLVAQAHRRVSDLLEPARQLSRVRKALERVMVRKDPLQQTPA
jgi:glycosyltransferase involved in cell wall biosynthesis